MIIDDPRSHFVFVYHPFVLMGRKYTVYNGRELTNGEILKYWGKWLVLGDKTFLDELAKKLDPYVEEKKIPCIKYDRRPSVNLGVEECVFMVYCDKRGRDEVWNILEHFGIKLKAWVTERETMELWMPGGPLLEQWIVNNGFDEATAEAARQDAGARFATIFDNPDEIFTSWEQ
ncbi:MAG: hypothetical protein GY866_21605 [Proteobacteria bacterium]|nr:hypothetical protein [Pseudomonadota bacterium]